MKKRFLCALLCLALLFSPVPSQPVRAASFADTPGHWAEHQISAWADRAIVQGGGGSFRPDSPITRGEAAAIIDRVLRYPASEDEGFPDLDPGAFYTVPIGRLHHAGVMRGYEDRTARPDNPIIRQEAVTLLARAFHVDAGSGGALPYSDSGEIAEYARETIQAFTGQGLLHGDNAGRFRPRDPITRAEFVTILDNMISNLSPADGKLTGDLGRLAVVNADARLSNAKAGAILIAPGVGEGTVTLDGVETDSLYVAGGGMHSVVISGDSRIHSVQINKQDSGVRVRVNGKAAAEVVNIEDGCSDVILTGAFQFVHVDSGGNTVRFENATVQSLIVNAENAHVTGGGDVQIKKLTIEKGAKNTVVVLENHPGNIVNKEHSASVTTGGGSGGSDSSSEGGASGGGSTGGVPSGGEPSGPPAQQSYRLTLRAAGGGSVSAREVTPGAGGCPLNLRINGRGMVSVRAVEPAPVQSGYPVRVHAVGHGMVIVEEKGE